MTVFSSFAVEASSNYLTVVFLHQYPCHQNSGQRVLLLWRWMLLHSADVLETDRQTDSCIPQATSAAIARFDCNLNKRRLLLLLLLLLLNCEDAVGHAYEMHIGAQCCILWWLRQRDSTHVLTDFDDELTLLSLTRLVDQLSVNRWCLANRA